MSQPQPPQTHRPSPDVPPLREAGPSLESPAAPPERLWRELVGEELRAIRTSRGESLRNVARRAAVSAQYLSEIERGYKEPSSEILAAIGTSLDISLLDLTSGVTERLNGASAGAREGAAGAHALTRGTVALAA